MEELIINHFFQPPGFKNIGGYLFIVFGSLCVLAALQAFTLYPETGRKSLEEIEQLFKKLVTYIILDMLMFADAEL